MSVYGEDLFNCIMLKKDGSLPLSNEKEAEDELTPKS